MIRTKYLLSAVLLLAAIAISPPTGAAATGGPSHAFDYQIGVWRVRVARLVRSGSAAAHWARYDGIHTVTPLLDGRANIGVLEIAGAEGSIEGLQLRLYDPRTQRWHLSFASAADGELQPPAVGRFAGSTGAFFSRERIAGREALVRTLTVVRGPSAYRDTVAYSTDAGRTWHPLWIATYAKIESGNAADDVPPARESNHDFDFQVGSWNVSLARLANRLRGSHVWRNYRGSFVLKRLWNGRANAGVLDVRNGDDRVQSIVLRIFDPKTRQWRDYGADPNDGTVGMPPVAGRFSDGRGELYDRETFGGRSIVVRYVFDEITPTSCRFEQAFSADDGKTWEPNAIVHFKRAGS